MVAYTQPEGSISFIVYKTISNFYQLLMAIDATVAELG